MNKRGVSNIIITVLLVLITLAAISVLWVAVSIFLESSTSEIQGLNLAQLEIVDGSAVFNPTTKQISLRIKRDSTIGNITGYKAIVEDLSEESKGIERDFYISEIESKYDYVDLPEGIITPVKISIAPIFIINKKKKTGSITDEEKLKLDLLCTSNSNCSNINPNFIFCVSGSCSECRNQGDCTDGEFCNGIEQCISGFCEEGIAVNTDDGIDCTADSCDEINDRLTHTNDNSLCTSPEVCNPTLFSGTSGCGEITQCTEQPEGSVCDDGNFCNGAEICQGQVCTITSPINPCDDGVACTQDTCDESSDSCSNTPVDRICDDGNMCDGIDYCDSNLGCRDGTPVNSDDGVACTIDGCNPSTGEAIHIPDDNQCSAGYVCDPSSDCVIDPDSILLYSTFQKSYAFSNCHNGPRAYDNDWATFAYVDVDNIYICEVNLSYNLPPEPVINAFSEQKADHNRGVIDFYCYDYVISRMVRIASLSISYTNNTIPNNCLVNSPLVLNYIMDDGGGRDPEFFEQKMWWNVSTA